MPKKSAVMAPITIPAIAPLPKLDELLDFEEPCEGLCEEEVEDGLDEELVGVYPGIKFLSTLQRTREAVPLKLSGQVVYWGQHASGLVLHFTAPGWPHWLCKST